MKAESPASERQQLFLSPGFWSAFATVWTACVLGLAISPMNSVDWYAATISDKTAHALAFAIGTIVWAFALRGIRPASFTPIIISGVISLGIGGLIELLQKFVPGRSAETGDLLADVIGVLIAVGILSISYYNRTKTSYK